MVAPIVAAAAPALVEGAVELGRSLIRRWFPDPEEAAKKELELAQMAREGEMQELVIAANLAEKQIEVNKEEAKSGRLFVAGWRPAIGWVCAVSLGVYYITRFLVGMSVWAYMCFNSMTMLPLPEMGVVEIIGLVGTLLGSSWIRSREKEKGIARENLPSP
jgi:hypothetical protein